MRYEILLDWTAEFHSGVKNGDFTLDPLCVGDFAQQIPGGENQGRIDRSGKGIAFVINIGVEGGMDLDATWREKFYLETHWISDLYSVVDSHEELSGRIVLREL